MHDIDVPFSLQQGRRFYPQTNISSKPPLQARSLLASRTSLKSISASACWRFIGTSLTEITFTIFSPGLSSITSTFGRCCGNRCKDPSPMHVRPAPLSGTVPTMHRLSGLLLAPYFSLCSETAEVRYLPLLIRCSSRLQMALRREVVHAS